MMGIQYDLSDSQALHSTWKAVTAAADTHLRDQVPKAYKVTAERILLKRQQAHFTSHVKCAFFITYYYRGIKRRWKRKKYYF